jgi:hypothetical protein
MREMLDAWDQLSFRGRIGAQLVGNHYMWRDSLCSHQPESGLPISAALQDSVEELTGGIDGAP